AQKKIRLDKIKVSRIKIPKIFWTTNNTLEAKLTAMSSLRIYLAFPDLNSDYAIFDVDIPTIGFDAVATDIETTSGLYIIKRFVLRFDMIEPTTVATMDMSLIKLLIYTGEAEGGIYDRNVDLVLRLIGNETSLIRSIFRDGGYYNYILLADMVGPTNLPKIDWPKRISIYESSPGTFGPILFEEPNYYKASIKGIILESDRRYFSITIKLEYL
ncbi:MAG: hypothetical protein Hyperionvirus39_16, partial [Hyperionvirus sp.]